MEERIRGDQNLWDKMTKVKQLGWDDNNKTAQTKISGEQITLKASNSLISRLLILAPSTRDVDLKEVVSTYEFSPINHFLMSPDGLLHPCNDKSELIHHLEHHGQAQKKTMGLELLWKTYPVIPLLLWLT